ILLEIPEFCGNKTIEEFSMSSKRNQYHSLFDVSNLYSIILNEMNRTNSFRTIRSNSNLPYKHEYKKHASFVKSEIRNRELTPIRHFRRKKCPIISDVSKDTVNILSILSPFDPMKLFSKIRRRLRKLTDKMYGKDISSINN